MSTILITTDYLRPGDDVDQFLRQRGYDTVHRPYAGRRSRGELDDLLVGMVGALIASEPLDARAIARGTSLRVIARSGVGYDSVDLDAATRQGVAVCNAPGTNSTAVAELTLTAMLMCARRVLEIVDGVRDGGWPRHDGHDLHGKVLGIIGFGPAGRRVAELARAFGLTVLVRTRWVDPSLAGELEFVSLPELLARSDYVSLHCKADGDNRGLIDGPALSRMRSDAYLINTARGSLVDERALGQAVQDGVIAGAVLDVLAEEPMPADHPFRDIPRITVLSHLAGQTLEARSAASISAARSIVDVLTGSLPGNCVNRQVWLADDV